MEKNIMEYTRKELLALPHRNWNDVTSYSSILLVPTYKLHDSGWRLIAIVGCKDDGTPKEIAAFCDDVQWQTIRTDYGISMDMIPKTNICRFHSRRMRFQVGVSLSSTDVKIVGEPLVLKR